MSLKTELESDVSTIFKSTWSVAEKQTIPIATDLQLGNDAGHFDKLTVLYADLDGSTNMVDNCSWSYSAEIYKTYLHCAAKLIKDAGGTITSYDGDSIMAVFIGDSKNTNAALCALKINYAVEEIIRPKMKEIYQKSDFVVRHRIGIDASEIHVARIGVKNDNDLVWVGSAANHAAKLTTIPDENFALWISEDVYDQIADIAKLSKSIDMWEKRLWTSMNNRVIYRSSYGMSF